MRSLSSYLDSPEKKHSLTFRRVGSLHRNECPSKFHFKVRPCKKLQIAQLYCTSHESKIGTRLANSVSHAFAFVANGFLGSLRTCLFPMKICLMI